MIYIEFCENRMIKEADITGDDMLNAKQLASLMHENEAIARTIAMAIPLYVSSVESSSRAYAEKMAEVLQEEYDNFFASAVQEVL